MILWSEAALRRNGRGIPIVFKMDAIPLHAGTLGSFSAWQRFRGMIERGCRFSTEWCPQASISKSHDAGFALFHFGFK